jgi:hypothetical protein
MPRADTTRPDFPGGVTSSRSLKFNCMPLTMAIPFETEKEEEGEKWACLEYAGSNREKRRL